MTKILDKLDDRLSHSDNPVNVPDLDSFRQFMEEHAKVRITGDDGVPKFVPYSTDGREPLSLVIDVIDEVIGSNGGQVLSDSHIYICGGAQFGKTILGLHLKAYLAAVRHLHCFYALPDNDLVQALVDGKERPEILDQIPWLNDMVQMGKALNDTGKAVNRKGAMLFNDGTNTAMTYMRGMNKIPTSISADAVVQDETDDVPPEKSKFLPGRMTSSGLRLFVAIGTQRYHGDGQNKLFEEGSQHVGLLTCPDCGHKMNPEESWPQICRVAVDGEPRQSDPQLTLVGDFKLAGQPGTKATFDHEDNYYFACTVCGTALDRTTIEYEARVPERIRQRKWSIRVSQMCCSGLACKMFVQDWCENAVRDPDAMIAFSCDRLAIPKSTVQALTPQVLHRARSLEDFSMSLTPGADTVLYGGLDTGDRCFFFAREVESATVKRFRWAEQVSTERARARIPLVFETLGLSALFIDIGAERNLARDLTFIINGLVDFDFSRLANLVDLEQKTISLGDLTWHGEDSRWTGIKCACVEFSLKPGQGIKHKLGKTQEGRLYPIIQCNRDESIQRVVNELLTAEEGVIEVINGKMRTQPIMRLPAKGAGANALVETVDKHLLAGSRKVKDGREQHFIDKIENHLLLADTYSSLAETVGGISKPRPFAYQSVEIEGHGHARNVGRHKGVLI